jgi:hypothetical protein
MGDEVGMCIMRGVCDVDVFWLWCVVPLYACMMSACEYVCIVCVNNCVCEYVCMFFFFVCI